MSDINTQRATHFAAQSRSQRHTSGSQKSGASARARKLGWWEEYHCGCVSETVKRKKDLLGYCARHGDSVRQVFPDLVMPNAELSDRRQNPKA